MANGSRSGALTFGIILIIIGAIFFLENWYPTFSMWDLIFRYWPVILIVVGVKKLYGYFTWKAVPPLPDSPNKE